ncbi:MAG: molybdopterin-dependent oxidoreductase, partial [Deltaproteobacteria bacterium]|nr:molybdopterin-dependent oxidoreductase [Deltaproteobacteria bacterium]
MPASACPHDCPDTCALQVRVVDGKVAEVRGHPDHPPTAGSLCTKVARYPERLYSPERLLYPLRRVGPKGRGQFERVSWAWALREVADRLGEIARRDPQRILPYSYAGTMGRVQGEFPQRFFHALGASLLDRTICASAGSEALKATLGASIGLDVEAFVDARLIVIWGSNSITSNLHFWSVAQAAKRRGARLWCIDPLRTATAARCDRHLAILPGTDGALVLGLLRELAHRGQLDREFMAERVLGGDELLQRAEPWTLARTAVECGVAEAEIAELAQDLASIRPAAVRLNYGMQRAAGGGNAVRLVASLVSLLGLWRDQAGGMLLSSSGHFPMRSDALTRPDLLPNRPRTINMVELGHALLQAQPPVEALVVYNSNPAAVAPDSTKVLAGLRRDDLFTVVLEHFATDTVDCADIVLPATMQFEHYDLHKSYGHRYLLSNQPVVAAPGECRPNSQIFRDLARAMGLPQAALYDDDRQVAQDAVDWSHPSLAGASLADLEQRGWLKLQVDDAARQCGKFPTLSQKVEIASSRLAEQGLDPLPDYVPNHQ